MSIFATNRYALSLSAAAALLAGCGESQPPLSVSAAVLAPQQSLTGHAYNILHEFGNSAGDGTNPYAGLIVVKGTLYGTTLSGGSNNSGTVFAITKTGEETVLHSFGGSEFSSSGDGAQPAAGLIDVNGTLYGTTYAGGAHLCGGVTCGTVFGITTSGTEKVLYSFGKEVRDGVYPEAALLDVGGTLYGTTSQGGKYGRGTVFIISTTGKERVLYSFGASGYHDGTDPSSALIDAGGTLYGTTEKGGDGASGTVFSITKFGRENLVYSFNGSDGSQPIAGLIDVKGVLYGTTFMGGVKNVGAVFSVTTSGEEKVLHSFRAGGGKNPYAGLVEADGTLYGTTYGSIYEHHGNVFSLNP